MLKAREITWIKDNKTILHGVDLELKRGECVGLIGPNGSGKSSLLKILAFLEQPTGGKIYLDGQEIPRKIPLEIRRKIAIVFQEPLLLSTNVFENVAVGLKMRRLPKAEIRTRVEYWLSAFGIGHLAKQHAHSLSGGEAQRVSLARALALNPDILFLDEPFSALDAPTVEELLEDLARIFPTTQTTTLLVSHNFRDIKRLSNRTIVLLNGKVEATGPTPELFSRRHSAEVEKFLAHFN